MGSLEHHKLVGMDGDDSCSSCHCERGEASRERLHTLFLRQRDPRLGRMATCVIVALLLLISGILVLLVIGLGGQCYLSPGGKAEKQTDHNSSGVGLDTESPQKQHPSAMLTAGNSSHGEYLLWESVIGYAYCHGGFSYSNGDLVVPSKGTYRVFLQITYAIHDDEDSATERKPWNKGPEMKLLNKVYVMSDSYPKDRILLSSTDTVQRRGQSLDKSMYTSGLFLLEANDRLHVTSSHPALIAKNEHQVFFGAELLK